MHLSIVQRWILSNQFRILEGLYPGEAGAYAEGRLALERGYELHYQWLCEHIARDDEVLTAEECGEVVDILTMYSVLQHSHRALADEKGVDPVHIRFLGFDGNHETKQMAYARYYCSQDGGNFLGLEHQDGLNSHGPMLDKYRRMLVEWKENPNRMTLTSDAIDRIVAAGD